MESTIAKAIRNKMSFTQIEQRIPAIVARQLSITVPEFHKRLATWPDAGIGLLVELTMSKFSEAEIVALQPHLFK